METLFLAILSLLILGAGLASHYLKNSSVTPPMLFVSIGLIIGPIGLGLLDLPFDHGSIKILLEITLILVLFTDGYRLCTQTLQKGLSIPLRLLSIAMPLSVIFGALVFFGISPSLGIWQAALLAAVLTPTDAALCAVAVGNPLVPRKLREPLIFESGMNDGLILPVILFLIVCDSLAAGQHYLLFWVIYLIKQFGIATLVGLAVGALGSRLIQFGVKKEKINLIFEQLSSIALALAAYSFTELLGGNGLIATFLAGIAFGENPPKNLPSIRLFAEAQTELFSLISFTLLGAVIAPVALQHLTWEMVAIACLALTLIRIASVALSLLGSGLKASSVAFLAWMGPRGVASLLFGLIVLESTTIQDREWIFYTVAFTVLLSVFAHGLTAVPFSNWLQNHSARSRPQ